MVLDVTGSNRFIVLLLLLLLLHESPDLLQSVILGLMGSFYRRVQEKGSDMVLVRRG